MSSCQIFWEVLVEVTHILRNSLIFIFILISMISYKFQSIFLMIIRIQELIHRENTYIRIRIDARILER